MCGGFAAIGIYSCPANNPVTTTVRIVRFEGVKWIFVLVANVSGDAMAAIHLNQFFLGRIAR
jgi:hypothetical protein